MAARIRPVVEVQKTEADWVKNEERPDCFLCNKSFNLARRRHHCRVCGEVVCDSCSKRQLIVRINGIKQAARACDFCVAAQPVADTIDRLEEQLYESDLSAGRLPGAPDTASPAAEPAARRSTSGAASSPVTASASSDTATAAPNGSANSKAKTTSSARASPSPAAATPATASPSVPSPTQGTSSSPSPAAATSTDVAATTAAAASGAASVETWLKVALVSFLLGLLISLYGVSSAAKNGALSAPEFFTGAVVAIAIVFAVKRR